MFSYNSRSENKKTKALTFYINSNNYDLTNTYLIILINNLNYNKILI